MGVGCMPFYPRRTRSPASFHACPPLPPLSLTQVNPEKRLGSGSGGAEDVKQHRWFANIDWAALEQRQLPAPILPQLTRCVACGVVGWGVGVGVGVVVGSVCGCCRLSTPEGGGEAPAAVLFCAGRPLPRHRPSHAAPPLVACSLLDTSNFDDFEGADLPPPPALPLKGQKLEEAMASEVWLWVGAGAAAPGVRSRSGGLASGSVAVAEQQQQQLNQHQDGPQPPQSAAGVSSGMVDT